MSSYDNTERNALVAFGAIFGMAAGVGLGMLLAPRSGQETRRQISDKARTAQDKAKQQFASKRDMAAAKLSQSLDKTKDMANKMADKSKDVADKTTARAKDAAQQARSETDTERS
ncbi:MAG TPA: YtxH domain-containing protein [Candidatus Saccharimonadales bacterium]|nr:YtxH domain-containing protein [Candidatus Saccharimonadales bacterium]